MNFKHLLLIALVFVLSFGVCSVALADETAEIPEGYTPIYTAEDLNNIRNNLDGKYILMNDIDLSAYENWQPIGNKDEPFTGELDGNGYTVRNMSISVHCVDTENNLGLFGVVQNGVFNKLIIKNGNISATHTDKAEEPSLSAGLIAGIVVGDDYMKTTNCLSDGNIEIKGFANVSVGGLIGSALNDNYVGLCVNHADINIITENYKQKIFAGGILGKTSEDINLYEESFFNIKSTANYGDISIDNNVCSEETSIYAGGISSYQITGNKLSECYNRGNISAQTSAGYLILGGIIGEAISRVENSYNTGNIVVPSDSNDKISSICNIKTPYLYMPEGPSMTQDYLVYNCYYLNNGLLSCYQNTDTAHIWYDNIVVLSDDEMKNQESFVGFDFENIWKMEENGYPVLRNQPVLPENIPEEPTAESTTKPNMETTTELSTDPITEPTTELTTNSATESITEALDNDCPLDNIWILKAMKFIFNKIEAFILYIAELIV